MTDFVVNADHIAPQDGGFEPQRSNHFEVEFYGVPGIDKLSFAVSTCNLPGVSNDPISIPFRNQNRKVAGAAQVPDISVSFTDYVDTPIHQAIMTWRRLVYNPETGRVGRAAEYKKRGKIFIFGPDGETVRSWVLTGVFPLSDPPLSLDSSNANPLMLEVNFSVDNCIPDTNLYLS